MLYLKCYQCSRSTSLDSFAYKTFVKKAIQKNFYIALTNTCVNKGVFICVNKFLNARARISDRYA